MARKKIVEITSDDVLQALQGAYPNNMVTDDVLFERDSYYEALEPEVRATLHNMAGTSVMYDRPPEGRSHWDEGANPEEDAPGWTEEASSYDLVFLGLNAKACHFEGEMPEDDVEGDGDGDSQNMVATEGQVGCVVAISTVAPFAAIRFSEIEWTESGTCTMPDLPHLMFNVSGGPLDLDKHYREWLGKEGYGLLCDLRAAVVLALEGLGIRVLREEELQAIVPGLEPNREINPHREEGFATVEEALFYLTFD